MRGASGSLRVGVKEYWECVCGSMRGQGVCEWEYGRSWSSYVGLWVAPGVARVGVWESSEFLRGKWEVYRIS